MSNRHIFFISVSLIAPLATAQQPPYPSKPIRLIASQAPSGGIDTGCRIVAPKLSAALGQTVRAVAGNHRWAAEQLTNRAGG